MIKDNFNRRVLQKGQKKDTSVFIFLSVDHEKWMFQATTSFFIFVSIQRIGRQTPVSSFIHLSKDLALYYIFQFYDLILGVWGFRI